MPTKKKICVKVYFNPANFPRAARIAEAMEKRRGGLQLFTQKPHGLDGELLSNTDGIAKALKSALWYWEENGAERMVKQAEALRKLEEAKKEARAAGVKTPGEV